MIMNTTDYSVYDAISECANSLPGYIDPLFNALVQSLTPEQRQVLDEQIERTHDTKTADKLTTKTYKRVEKAIPHYMLETMLPNAFYIKGKRQVVRREIIERFPYLCYSIQYKLLMIFLTGGKSDRIWAMRYLDTHWDPSFESTVIELFEQHHDWQAARLISRYANTQYMAEHIEELGRKSYVSARVRLPKDAPIKTEWLTPSSFLYLAVKLELDLSPSLAWAIFADELLHLCRLAEIQDDDLPEIHFENPLPSSNFSSLLWCMGNLHATHALLWFKDIFARMMALPVWKRCEFLTHEVEAKSKELHKIVCDGEFPKFYISM